MDEPNTYPTTSDISMFMKELGFYWSNDAQIYYHANSSGYEHITRNTAERLYLYLMGNNPYKPLK